MTTEIKIVPRFFCCCCVETLERVLTPGVESFQNTAIKRAVLCYGDTISRPSDVTEVKKIQQLPAFTENHSEKKKRKKKHEKNNIMRYKHCAKVRDTGCAAVTRFLPSIHPSIQAGRQGEGRKGSRAWKQETHVRPHGATFAFNATLTCTSNTPTRSHLPAISACPVRPSAQTDGLALQQLFTDERSVYCRSITHQMTGLNLIRNNNKCYRQRQKKRKKAYFSCNIVTLVQLNSSEPLSQV